MGVKYVDNQFDRSKEEILLILKALIASNIWHSNEYYRIINENDPVIDKAREIISDAKTYNSILARDQTIWPCLLINTVSLENKFEFDRWLFTVNLIV